MKEYFNTCKSPGTKEFCFLPKNAIQDRQICLSNDEMSNVLGQALKFLCAMTSAKQNINAYKGKWK